MDDGDCDEEWRRARSPRGEALPEGARARAIEAALAKPQGARAKATEAALAKPQGIPFWPSPIVDLAYAPAALKVKRECGAEFLGSSTLPLQYCRAPESKNGRRRSQMGRSQVRLSLRQSKSQP